MVVLLFAQNFNERRLEKESKGNLGASNIFEEIYKKATIAEKLRG